MENFVYKVMSAHEWRQAQSTGVFTGSPVDIESGFIHFSSRSQLAETLAKHFAGQDDLVVLQVDATGLSQMKWEPSRGGALFPHLYEELKTADVFKSRTIRLNLESGIHDLGDL